MTKSIPLIIIVLAVYLLLFSMSGCEERDVIFISDFQLRSKINANLRMAPDAPIAAEDMLRLNKLDAEFQEFWDGTISKELPIFNLTGLEYAENLVVLLLMTNSISDVNPLKGLNNLRELNLRDNFISDVSPLEGLNNLRWLYLNDNHIVDVRPLQGLKNLQKLDLRNNPLSYYSKNLIIPIIEANGTEVLFGN